ncbi:hypothetical protein [Roseateles koreensis]|uniref:ABC-2 type transport system permease protein n=1 Tax=Roseateles koreensis TaxID=2987526 RepID=A0ABT5KX74_9BURK|nr:hypothetical protein [Roseateles koreensis]MDC8786995.1 hypothetical protein [Roseateles koreensis]
MSTRFQTLLLREWLQHKRGWLITLLLPLSLFVALLPVGQVQGLPTEFPLGIALLIMGVTCLGVFAIVEFVALFQLPGLARRDQQDRSIEFWLSLPASHSESIGATLLAHALLLPLVALLVGAAAAPLMAAAVLFKQGGATLVSAVPWSSALTIGLLILLRTGLGLLMMSLWIAPVMLALMAASAWLKRWGMPALAIGVGMLGLLLSQGYNNPIVWQLLDAQQEGAKNALLINPEELAQRLHEAMAQADDGIPHILTWLAQDAWLEIQHLACAQFIGGLVLAAACFGLLVLKRSRSH